MSETSRAPETYVIRLKNCAFFARHGLLEAEERLGQRFFVDVVLTVRPTTPLIEDDMNSTVDYGAVFDVIEKMVHGKRRFLIEALAKDIGMALIERFTQLVEAEVTVRKPNAPVPGVLDYAEVTVTTRADT